MAVLRSVFQKLPAAMRDEWLTRTRQKVLVLGDSGVGKTTLITALMNGRPPEDRLVRGSLATQAGNQRDSAGN